MIFESIPGANRTFVPEILGSFLLLPHHLVLTAVAPMLPYIVQLGFQRLNFSVTEVTESQLHSSHGLTPTSGDFREVKGFLRWNKSGVIDKICQLKIAKNVSPDTD